MIQYLLASSAQPGLCNLGTRFPTPSSQCGPCPSASPGILLRRHGPTKRLHFVEVASIALSDSIIFLVEISIFPDTSRYFQIKPFDIWWQLVRSGDPQKRIFSTSMNCDWSPNQDCSHCLQHHGYWHPNAPLPASWHLRECLQASCLSAFWTAMICRDIYIYIFIYLFI